MRSLRILPALTLFLLGLPAIAQKGEGPLDPSPPQGITPQEIIQRFAAKETQFKEARDNYTYRQSIKVETPDDGGRFEQVWDVLFDDSGRRVENVVFAPQSSLQLVSMSREDFEDIRNVLPFVLTSAEIPLYDVSYVGRQQEDELTTYVFDVRPKQIDPKKRYFDGRIWVDDHDFQIVKTKGRTVPEFRVGGRGKKVKAGQENLFPAFTTWREQVDGQYWFPTYTRADDTLHFSTGDVRIRETIKYTNYKRFGSKVRITYEGQELPPAPQGKSGQDSRQQQPK
ncbi:MAG TPA: hypothetical protein VMT05_03810 [Terriglobales bacterium]|jgi:hypothetical protein|nr:hypothetical protein [Terriglobales bacterium]